MGAVPVWVWLPGEAHPVLAGELTQDRPAHFHYHPGFLGREDALALDPVELRLVRSKRGIVIRASDGLPGVLRDAKPAGYGADRLNAQAGAQLSPLELLEQGIPDGVGAVEACQDIERKLNWRPHTLEALRALAEDVDAPAPASRALRQLNQDLDTSAGGERPKTTLMHAGQLWLAKMQDRADRPALPAREFVTMRLAQRVGLNVAPVELHTLGAHQVLLVKRFDRAGDPLRPHRRLYASAHTVLQLAPETTKGDPRRSYLHLGDRLRVWARGEPSLPQQLRELWRRMAFQALVGNVDDHPLNHGFLHHGQPGGAWQLAPAFDITPVLLRAPQPLSQGPALAMATGADGGARASQERLLAAAGHFGLSVDEASQWLHAAALLVAQHWAPMLREAVCPIQPDHARVEGLICEVGEAFAYAEFLAQRG